MDLRETEAVHRPSRWTCAMMVRTAVATAVAMAASPVMAMEPAPATEPVPIQRPTLPASEQTPAPEPEAPAETTPSEPETPADTIAAEPTTPPAVAVEPSVPESSGSNPLYIELVDEGTMLLSAGRPGEAAQRFSDAYVAMPPEVRVSDDGRNTVAWATTAFSKAEPTPDRLDAEHTLLTAYFADLGEARAANRPAAAPNPLEQKLSDRLAIVEQQIASREQGPGADELGPIDGSAPTVPPPDRRERAVALTLVSLGAAGIIGGGIMVITGARAASEAERQREMTPIDQASEARRAKTGGVMLVSFGALIVSGAVMMLGVGSNRLSSIRARSGLSLSPTRHGLALSGRF